MTSTTIKEITVKACLAGSEDIRRFTLDSPTMPSITCKLNTIFALNEGTRLLYTDTDGDAITLQTDGDLQEALADITSGSGPRPVLRVTVLPAEIPTAEKATDKKAEKKAAKAEKKAAKAEAKRDLVTEKVQWLAKELDTDMDSARAVVHSAVNGDAEAITKLLTAKHKMRMEKKAAWLQRSGTAVIDKKLHGVARALGNTDTTEAKALIHAAVDGDVEAIQKLSQLKKKFHGHKRRGGGPFVGPMAGPHGGPRGKPLVHALVRLTAMDRHEARQTVMSAMQGDQTAQAKVGSALEAAGIAASSGTDSSTDSGFGSSSDSGDEGTGRRRMAVSMLQMLAGGDIEGLQAAKMAFAQKHGMRGGKGGCGGKGKSHGKGHGKRFGW